MSERPSPIDVPSRLGQLSNANAPSKAYQGFMCNSRMLSGKNTESVDTTTTKAGISVKTNVRFSNRKCMKYAMMSAAFTSDSPIKSTSITCTEN